MAGKPRARDKEERNSLHSACKDGRLDLVRSLIQSGAGINVRDEFGRTPLHWSCEKGHTELATALVEAGADVRLQDACGRAPLEWATRAGDLPLVQFLVKNGATVKTVNSDGKTVLHLASHKGYTEIAEFFIEKSVDIHAKDMYDRTALHPSCNRGHLQIAQMLIEHGAQVNQVILGGNTPLLNAAWRGFVPIVQLLLQHGADINATDNTQENALHKAASTGSSQVVKLILEQFSQPQSKSMLRSCTSPQDQDRVAHIHSVNQSRKTALHLACKGAHPEVVRLLIAAGADIAALDAQGKTPLHWACVGPSAQALSSLQVASFLTRSGADVNVTDVDGASPLHLACSNGHLDLMSFLIKSGAFLSLERACDRSLMVELLKREPHVNKSMLYNVVQENALVPHPRPGCSYRVERCSDLLEGNSLDVLDPARLCMLHTLGYHIPSVYSHCLEAHRRKSSRDDRWSAVLDHIGAADCAIQSLTEICRFSIRSHLGIGIRHKIDGLVLPAPESYTRYVLPSHPTTIALPNKLKDFLMFSELDEDAPEEPGCTGIDCPLR